MKFFKSCKLVLLAPIDVILADVPTLSTTRIGKMDKSMTIRNWNFPFKQIHWANPSDRMIEVSYLAFWTRVKKNCVSPPNILTSAAVLSSNG